MPYQPPPELAGLSLAQVAEQVAARKLPPVEQWSPEKTGDVMMRLRMAWMRANISSSLLDEASSIP